MKKLDDASTKVTIRIFTADIRTTKERARAQGYAWQTYLRGLIRRGLMGTDETLTVWKFIIPVDDRRPDKDGLEWNGCTAVCIAKTERQALAQIVKYAEANGLDTRWLEIADVIRLPVAPKTVVTWSQQ